MACVRISLRSDNTITITFGNTNHISHYAPLIEFKRVGRYTRLRAGVNASLFGGASLTRHFLYQIPGRVSQVGPTVVDKLHLVIYLSYIYSYHYMCAHCSRFHSAVSDLGVAGRKGLISLICLHVLPPALHTLPKVVLVPPACFKSQTSPIRQKERETIRQYDSPPTQSQLVKTLQHTILVEPRPTQPRAAKVKNPRREWLSVCPRQSASANAAHRHRQQQVRLDNSHLTGSRIEDRGSVALVPLPSHSLNMLL